MAADKSNSEVLHVPLRNPGLAAFLAWLIPGAGHLYQRRYFKAAIFAVCVLGCYFFGLSIGDGHVVYASWTKEDPRWQFVFQAGVGLPALPALVQNRRVMSRQEPLVADVLAPPAQPVEPKSDDELHQWHLKLGPDFELGTLYTMIAGLMNVLAIYDAFAGPMVPVSPSREESDDEEGDRQSNEKSSSS